MLDYRLNLLKLSKIIGQCSQTAKIFGNKKKFQANKIVNLTHSVLFQYISLKTRSKLFLAGY